ncbi:MAG TPA: PDZ domain-containing protein [Clostridia bacterium]|nr:PDZ domain-containing protein [Clostridia bacterium]
MSVVDHDLARRNRGIWSFILVGFVAGLIAALVVGIAMPIFFPEVAAYWVEKGVQAGLLPGEAGRQIGSARSSQAGTSQPLGGGSPQNSSGSAFERPAGADRASLGYPENAYPAVYAAERVGPAVVGVVNRARVLDYFSGRARIVDQGSGSGVVIDEQGHIVTNYHVVEDAAELVVVFSGKDGTNINVPADVVGVDPATDLAVLKIDPAKVGYPLVPATFGDSDLLKVGEPVIAIGNPVDMEFQHSVTAGVISGLNRKISYGERTFRLIQTDAVINPGNSGGPLVNMDGEVIGINTMKINLPKVEGMGFAIPSNTVKPIIAELMTKGRVTRPWLGIGVVDKERAALYGINIERGLYVGEVTPGGPSARAGVRTGDVVVAVNGKQVNSYADLRSAVEEHKVGDTVDLTIIRGGKTIKVRVTLGEMPATAG